VFVLGFDCVAPHIVLACNPEKKKSLLQPLKQQQHSPCFNLQGRPAVRSAACEPYCVLYRLEQAGGSGMLPLCAPGVGPVCAPLIAPPEALPPPCWYRLCSPTLAARQTVVPVVLATAARHWRCWPGLHCRRSALQVGVAN
jgi:hypothetical protein